MKVTPTHAILIAIAVVIAIGAAFIVLPHAAQQIAQPAEQASSTSAQTATSTTDDWKIGNAVGLTFRYPEKLSTTFIHATDWPPKVSIATTSAACVQKSDEMGQTESRTIAGASYCVTTLAEGAAGSTYTTYAYRTQKEGKSVTVGFTLRTVQCENYDEPQKTSCKDERAAFSVDDLVQKMVASIVFK